MLKGVYICTFIAVDHFFMSNNESDSLKNYIVYLIRFVLNIHLLFLLIFGCIALLFENTSQSVGH
jgi:hypothetical protein